MDTRWLRPALIVGVVLLMGGEIRGDDVAAEVKHAGKSIAKAAKRIGHEVAETAQDVSEAAAEGGKTAWFETRDWTTRTSKQVGEATVRFWNDVIRGKEAKRDRLRRENESLRAKASEKGE